MKKKFFFLPFLAAMALAGCSSSDEPEGGSSVSSGEDSYIAVRIMATNGSNMGRGTEGGFEAAPVDMENDVKEAVFLFFDKNGNSTQSPQTADLTFNDPGTGASESIEKISNATVVVAGSTAPTQMLCVLNPKSDFIRTANGKGLSDVLTQVNNYSASKDGYPYGESGGFLLSNSTYIDAEGNEVCATQIDVAKQAHKTIKEAQEATGDKVVQVYVERVIAKVITSPKETSGIVVEDSEIKINGKESHEVVLTPVIHGIEIANIANSSYLFKHIKADWSWKNITGWTGATEWNDAANFRSYWADMPSSMILYVNSSWNEIGGFESTSTPTTTPDVAPAAVSGDNPEYFRPNEANTFYISENTGAANKSSVLITATLKLKNADGTLSDAGETFVYWGGNYYTKDAILTQYATQLSNEGVRIRYWDSRSNSWMYRSIDPDNDVRSANFRWLTKEEHAVLVDNGEFKEYETAVVCTYELDKTNKDYPESFVRLVPETVTKEGYEPITHTDVNNILKEKKNRSWIWNNGQCYYYAEIEHFGPKVNGGIDFSTGVVRNHVYKLTLESLMGLGTPVYDPDVDIIPEKPVDNLFYVAAQVNILKWKVVNQTVNFN